MKDQAASPPIKLLSPRRGIIRQLATFGAVSVATTLLDFACFNLLVVADMPVVPANTISYGLGIVASYLLNKHVTFARNGRDKRSHEMALFLAINLVGLGLNNAAVALAVAVTGRNALLLNAAKLVAGAVIWGLKYFGFKRWVYPAPLAVAETGRD